VSAPGASGRANRWIAVAASIVVIATIVAAIAIMGSPSRQRLLRLDERRVDDLQRIATAIDAYDRQHGGAPPTLAALAATPGVRLPSDPESGRPYGYERTGEAEYRLCAEFRTDTADATGPRPWQPADWVHGMGRQCFKRRSDTLRD
jgi:hypothetical protein